MEDNVDYKLHHYFEQYYPYSSGRPPNYEEVHQPEPKWPPHYLAANQKELETVDEVEHVGEFGMKPLYRYGTHEEDKLAGLYRNKEGL